VTWPIRGGENHTCKKPGRTMEYGCRLEKAGVMTTQSWPSLRIRLERMLIGSGLSLLAWILEQAILHSARRE
jgi:hypothetical protein